MATAVVTTRGLQSAGRRNLFHFVGQSPAPDGQAQKNRRDGWNEHGKQAEPEFHGADFSFRLDPALFDFLIAFLFDVGSFHFQLA